MSISCSITSPTIHPPCGHRALRVPASHRPLVGGGRVATGARRLPTRLANVVAQVAEVLADLVPGVPDLVLEIRAVDAAGGLLEVGLDCAVGALDLVHRCISFQSVADDLVASVALAVPCHRLRPQIESRRSKNDR